MPTAVSGYKHLPLYWSEPDRPPFLVKLNGKLAGLALVKKGSHNRADVWEVGEFFIVRAYRRQGIGMKIAHEVWKRFSEPWEVRVMKSNRVALNFWHRAIAAFIGEAIHPSRIEKENEFWQVFAFESKQTPWGTTCREHSTQSRSVPATQLRHANGTA